MTTFHSRQSDCDRRTRKNENTGTFNFTSQIAPSICTVAYAKCEEFDATIFTSWCSRLSQVCHFRQGHALPLVGTRFSCCAHRRVQLRENVAVCGGNIATRRASNANRICEPNRQQGLSNLVTQCCVSAARCAALNDFHPLPTS